MHLVRTEPPPSVPADIAAFAWVLVTRALKHKGPMPTGPEDPRFEEWCVQASFDSRTLQEALEADVRPPPSLGVAGLESEAEAE